MTESRPWPYDRATAERYAALRHPALPSLRLVDTAEGPTLLADPPSQPVSPADDREALQAVGEVALGLAALHELPLVHGGVTPDAVRDAGGHVVLAGFARPGSDGERHADVACLAGLMTAWRNDRPLTPAAADLTARAAAGEPAAAVARRALALAAAGSTAGRSVAVTSSAVTSSSLAAATASPVGAAEREQERRRLRNRLVIAGVLVVAAGAAILALLDRTGTVTVPNEVGRPLSLAVADLHRAGLAEVTTTARGGGPVGPAELPRVLAQNPAAGTAVRPGRVIDLTVGTGLAR